MKYLSLYLVSFILLTLVGCNVFEWTANPTSATDYLNTGRVKLSQGDYQGALSDFRNAVNENPNSSEARYAYAKARLYVTGINSLDVLSSLSQFDLSSNNLTISFFNNTLWPNERATDLYVALDEIQQMLAPIFNNQTTGSISAHNVALDYGVSQTVFGLLQLRDNNRDMIINNADVDVSLIWLNGRFNLNGIIDLYNQQGYQTVNTLLNNGSNFITNLIHIIDTVVPPSSGFNSENLRATVDSIRTAMNSYRINDLQDNDGDGLIDEVVLGIQNVEFYLNMNYQIRSRNVNDNFGHDAAGSINDNPRPWTNEWLATLSQSKKDSLRRNIP
ncbi:MAG: hypothetical protein N2450_07225 [bacterium]|nr:hypothetical protein [bacterium]